MTATWFWYGNGVKNATNGNLNFSSDTFKIMLVTSSYTPNQDTHIYRSDVTNEVSGTGYTAGGNTLTGASVTYDAATNETRISWSGGNTWASSTITARGCVIYKSRGGLATADELVAYAVDSADVSSSAGTFTVSLPSPLLKITAS